MLHSSFSASFRLSCCSARLNGLLHCCSAIISTHLSHCGFFVFGKELVLYSRGVESQHVCGNKITPKNFIIVPYQYIYISILGKDVQNNFGRSDKLKIVNEEVGWWVRRVTVRLMRWSQRLRASPSPPLRDLICWATRIN